MTNYATKHDVSQYQLILTAAILKRALEDARSVADPSETQLRLRRQGMDKFALQAFNRLSGDRERAASSLLGHPDFYALPTTIRRLNLRHLRYRLDHVLAAEPGAFGEGDETARVTIARKAPSTFFDHYRWRGPRFSGLCLYEYVKLVVVKTMASAISTDIPFLPETPSMRPTFRTTPKGGAPMTTLLPSPTRFPRTSLWRIASVAVIPRPTPCRTTWLSVYSLCWSMGTSSPPVRRDRLQGGDQAVRRLDTNAYLGVSDRQSRHIIGYRQSRQS